MKTQSTDSQQVKQQNQEQKLDFQVVKESIIEAFDNTRQTLALFKPKNKKEYNNAIIALLYYCAFFDVSRVLWAMRQILQFDGLDAIKLCDTQTKEQFLYERASSYKKSKKVEAFSALSALKVSELKELYNNLRDGLNIPSNELSNEFIAPLLEKQAETKNKNFSLQPAPIENLKPIECFLLAKNSQFAKVNLLPVAVTRENLVSFETGKLKKLHYFTALNVGEKIV